MAAATLDLLERAMDQMGAVVAAVRADQMSLPTPCAEWDVRMLLRHVVCRDLPNFAVAARGVSAGSAAETAELGDDWAADFRAGAQEVLDIWRGADLDQPVPMSGGATGALRVRADQQITELTVHAWDIARATGQRIELDPAVAEHALAWSGGMLRPEHRGAGKAFGPEVPVAGEAQVYERLAGWFGRDPSWAPAAPHA